MTELLAHIRFLQKQKKEAEMRFILRVTAGRKTHDIPCIDLLDLAIDGGNLKALGAKDLRQFSVSHSASDGTVSIRELTPE